MKSITMRDWEVLAILGGTKKRFTRPIKPQPEYHGDNYYFSWRGDRFASNFASKVLIPHAPYQVGDVLYVKEACKTAEYYTNNCGGESHQLVHYRADGKWLERAHEFKPSYREFWTDTTEWVEQRLAEGKILPYCDKKWRPSAKWASRLTLRVKKVTVQRVREISSDDAYWEGVEDCHEGDHDDCFYGTYGYKCSFEQLWDSIYAKPKPVRNDNGEITHYTSMPWHASGGIGEYRGKPHYIYSNPRVWTVSFERV